MSDLEFIVGQLDRAKKSSDGWVARCPAHEDGRPSLSITENDEGRILLFCHAGCTFEDIKAKLRWPERERETPGQSTVVATYDYVDEAKTLLYQVVRMAPKKFLQRKPDGSGGWIWKLEGTRRVPYRLPQILAAVAGRRVIICEGEKDVQTLERLGFVATTNAGGAGKWLPEFAGYFRGAHVVVIPDNDESGRDHARAVKASLDPVAASVRIVDLPGLPAKGDVTDWVNAGGTAESLKALVLAPEPGAPTLLDAVKSVSRFKTEAIPPGVDFPWSPIQRRTRGLRPGWFSILAGYPGSGKSAAALEIVFSAAKQQNRVLFNSLELNAEEIALRMVQRWGLDTEHLYANRLDKIDRLAFDAAADFEDYRNVVLAAERTLTGLENYVDEVKPDLVVVDYIGLMDMGGVSEYEGTTRLSRGLKALARTRDVPVLALSQLSRPQDRRKGKIAPPGMHDLRSSGALECDADHVIIVFRELPKEGENTSRGMFIVAKSRHADAGCPVAFEFNGPRQTFELSISERAVEQGWSVYEGGQA